MTAELRVGACLSLSGRHVRFGAPSAQALRVWQSMAGTGELILEDDESSTRVLERVLPWVASRCDVLLGPYSTQLARAAAGIAAHEGLLLWNHGGAGDDVQVGHPGHVVSVLTPASRYAEPFLRYLAHARTRHPLWIVQGAGRFARQVVAGAARLASHLGLGTHLVSSAEELPPAWTESWSLLTAGSFDEDVRTVNHAQSLPFPPRTVCAVAAGVSEFRRSVADPDGVFGIAQWVPGNDHTPQLGPTERDFLATYPGAAPDYPAVQAAASAILGTHCARLAGGTTHDLLWPTAARLDTDTLYGPFRIDPTNGAQAGHGTVLVRWDTVSSPEPSPQVVRAAGSELDS